MLKDVLPLTGKNNYERDVLCFFDDSGKLCGCEATNGEAHIQIGETTYDMGFIDAKEIKPYVKKSSVILKRDGRLVIDDQIFEFDEPCNNFPVFEQPDDWQQYILDCEQLVRVASVSYINSLNVRSAYYTNGVLYKGKDIVATDGHRLRLEHYDMDCPHDDLLINSQYISALSKIKKPVGPVTLCYDGCNMLMLVKENVRLKFPMFDCRFPEYYRVIPEGEAYLCDVDSKPMVEALKELSKIYKASTETNHTVIIDFGLSKLLPGKTKLSYRKDHQTEERDVEWTKDFDQWNIRCNQLPNDIIIAINLYYLKDALEHCTDTARIIWNGRCFPLVVRSDNGTEVIMPIRMD